ncbi:MAG: 3'-5' exonuclease [Gammaproteobacteria bacterium]
MNTPVLAVDIETVPDAAGLRLVHDMPPDVPDAEVVAMAQRLRRQEKNNDFMPLPLHRIVVISCVLEENDSLRVFSLPAAKDEGDALRRFFAGMEKLYQTHREPPRLITWNGGGFDLPVMHYRSLIHGLRAPLMWQNGDGDANFRYNRTYLNRYNTGRHLDLMDTLAMFQFGAAAKLDNVAKLCGLPGKIGIGGAHVADAFFDGRMDEISDYCECDAMLTYLLFLRYQQLAAERGETELAARTTAARQYMTESGGKWEEFLRQWRGGK